LLEQGIAQAEIARRLNVDPRSVRRWKHDQRLGGWAALKAIPASGRPLKLTPGERQRLEKQLHKGARAAEHIERAFGVRYHVDHVGRLLHAMNLSPHE